ncbi:siroheme synthase CysG [Paraglaciecola hydrolytica]|uniref:Siroheme synthase n=1 Tax=Paraglaciecola hydrolytica TaxID=1799789 RepID=A0A136A3B4_9ALTE|nr:siroheme synthase CysG [Paraglaciecola hydrolytica]KXI29735.1 sirohydrochlorin ferrochelatase [Paraglaciecola hydrolytica]
MQYFPIFLDTSELNCLVVGAGEVAARKVELLLKTSAQVTVVAPWACSTILRLVEQQKIVLHERPFTDSDLDAKQLVFVATNDSHLNANIHALAKAQKILVNVVDNIPLCQFITPSIIDRSPIVIAISSGGVAPVLLRYMRQKLESLLPHKISLLGQFSEKFRELAKQKLATVTARRFFWEDVLDGDIAENVIAGNDALAEQKLLAKLEHDASHTQAGEVYLVGAGPGDPDLLTFKALRLMQKADVVVYDRLVSPEILELVRRDAEKIYVGKAKSNHSVPQENINELLAREALAGKRVVRLKGGDPFIFGRGGEEIETLVAQGINFQVVPGITAANGAASYCGIPLTHRDHAKSVVFATGHLQDNTINLNWKGLAQADQTIVFYMGLTGLATICEKLVEYGLPASTPIAMIQSATTAKQKIVVGELSNMVAKVAEAGIQPPSLIIVGSVVSLQSKLQWFKQS